MVPAVVPAGATVSAEAHVVPASTSQAPQSQAPFQHMAHTWRTHPCFDN